MKVKLLESAGREPEHLQPPMKALETLPEDTLDVVTVPWASLKHVNPTTSIQALQILRAVAALLVVFCHSPLLLKHMANSYWPDQSTSPGNFPAFFNHLDIGVDIFFCISGYIMAMLLERAGSGCRAALNFLAKRAVRIYPPYWAFTILVIIVFVASKEKLNVGILSGNIWEDSIRILKSSLLIPQAIPPVLNVGWTLIYEFQFYLLCGVIVLLSVNPAARLTQALVGISTVAVCLALYGYEIAFGTVFSTFYLEFLLGALVFHLGRKITTQVPGIQCVLAIILYFLLAELLDTHWEPFGTSVSITRQAGGAFVGALLISGFIGLDERYAVSNSPIGKLLCRIGDASYTLYLSHWFVLSFIGKVAGAFPNASVFQIILVHVIGMGMTIPCAIYISEKLEMPIHRWLGARLRPAPSSGA